MATCTACHDTRRVPIEDCGDDDLCFTDCWECNENASWSESNWDDDRCSECGGRFVYPVCLARDCYGTAERMEDR